jgi:AcrR family transcriptional regulator
MSETSTMASRPAKRTSRKAKGSAPRNAGRTSERARRRKPTELDLRRTPLQARGQATFEGIVNATARLLDEVGTEGISTNLIARAAGVNIATLYQYFPNKQAVLLALFQRQSDQRIAIIERMVAGLGFKRDWRRMVNDMVDAVAALRRNEPGATALRQAMRSSPELREHDVLATRQSAQRLADELVNAGGLAVDEAHLVARCSLELLASLLDVWTIESGGSDDRIVEQSKAVLERYLAPHLSTASRRTALRRRA